MFVCGFSAEWRSRRPFQHLGLWLRRTERCAPQVSCQSQSGPPSTGSTCPSHQGDGGKEQGCSDGGVIMNSCCGRLSGGGYQANMSTRSPLARLVAQQKPVLRGLWPNFSSCSTTGIIVLPGTWFDSVLTCPPLFVLPPDRRAHFLHGPYPATHFGPKACILPNPTSVM